MANSESNPMEVLQLKRIIGQRKWDKPRMPVKAMIRDTQLEFNVTEVCGGEDAMVLMLDPVATKEEPNHE